MRVGRDDGDDDGEREGFAKFDHELRIGLNWLSIVHVMTNGVFSLANGRRSPGLSGLMPIPNSRG
jgi:hypothetical protein